MAEKMSEVFEMYDVRFDHVGRGRGAIVLHTDKGVRQLRAQMTGEKRLQAEYEFKERMWEAGFSHIDRLVKNTENELVTYDRYGNPYVMRMYFDGREMNVCNRQEIVLAVDNLVSLHKAGQYVWNTVDRDIQIRERNDVRRRNREMKRVYNYIAKRNPKREFETLYGKAFPYFYAQGLACECEEPAWSNPAHLGYCHGSYNHHSVLICGNGEEKYIATINFEKYHIGNQLQDLYYFIRKTVEKNGYAFSLMTTILEEYQKGISLTQADIGYIYDCYRYPEKFYKLSNQYMNSSKSRISPKMEEKLNRIIEEEEKKQSLLKKLEEYNISKK